MTDTVIEQDIFVPNIGDISEVEVIEVLVKPGDEVQTEDSLITLESDKASMDVPSPHAGTVKTVHVAAGDQVKEGSMVLTLNLLKADELTESETSDPVSKPDETSEKIAKSASSQDIFVPDIGDISEVEVIEVLVKPGDEVQPEDSLITLESDKASMDVPSPHAGTVKTVHVTAGDRVKEGSMVLSLNLLKADKSTESETSDPASKPDKTSVTIAESASSPEPEQVVEKRPSSPVPSQLPRSKDKPGPKPHASPSIRRFARELGADLTHIKGSGRKGRILQEDVRAVIKSTMERANKPGISGLSIADTPQIDFSQFGKTETQPLSRINKLSASHLHRCWVTIPHVTQHDQADITDLEAFRQSLKPQAQQQQLKVTLLPFLMKALVSTLKSFPKFNASLDSSGEQLILKHYFHIGVAVDTPDGLVVPVIPDVDQKGIWELSGELGELSERARNKKLVPRDLQGGCCTISSLGGISGTAFTPIINAPEVAILGVSRANTQAVFQDGEFKARLILPLSLSYDHRVIDGAEAARFTSHLTGVLSDSRRLLL